MKTIQTLACVALVLGMGAITGCTARSWYEGSKMSAVNYCNHLPPGDVDQCLKGVNKQSYEEYEKERAGQQ